jgi:hypothetical protein
MMIGTLSSGVGSLPTIGPDVGEPPTLPSTIILTITQSGNFVYLLDCRFSACDNKGDAV